MSMSRKQALEELHAMFPEYDKKALSTLLSANGTLNASFSDFDCIDNMLTATIDYILQLNEGEQQNLRGNEYVFIYVLIIIGSN